MWRSCARRWREARANRSPALGIEQLARAVEALPVHTSRAMLDALRCPDTHLITGAYTARVQGVCPMLAAHRRGGRQDGGSKFADAWDAFTGTARGRPRPA